MRDNRREENQYLYALKTLACVLIVFWHFPIQGTIGQYIAGFARISVPIFFIIQGRYLAISAKRTPAENREKNKRTLYKLLKYAIGISAVYAIASYGAHWLEQGLSFSEWAAIKFNPTEWIQLLLFNSSKVIYDDILYIDHLWYLFAAVYVVLIVIIIQKKISIKTSVIMMSPLVVQFVDRYCLKFLVNIDRFQIQGMSIEGRLILRNFLFIGIPFVGFGIFLQLLLEKREQFFEKARTKEILFGCIVVGVIITFLEQSAVGIQEMYIGTSILAMALTAFSLCHKNCGSKILVFIGKNLSQGVYFWHPLMAYVLGNIIKIHMPVEVYPFLILLCTVFVSYVIYLLKVLYEKIR